MGRPKKSVNTIQPKKKKKPIRTIYNYEVGEEVLYTSGIYSDEFNSEKGNNKMPIVEKSQKHGTPYYKIKAEDDFIFTVSEKGIKKIEGEIEDTEIEKERSY